MTRKLPYSGRYDYDDELRRLAAWEEYRFRVQEAGIHRSDPIYRYFVGDAFHDSPIQVSFSLDFDQPDIKLNMRNIRRLDQMTSEFKIDAKRSDFQPGLTCVRCHRVEFDLNLCDQHWYQASAISIVDGLLEVAIATSSSADATDDLDVGIRLLAEDVRVEDITQSLSSQYGVPPESIEQMMQEWHE